MVHKRGMTGKRRKNNDTKGKSVSGKRTRMKGRKRKNNSTKGKSMTGHRRIGR